MGLVMTMSILALLRSSFFSPNIYGKTQQTMRKIGKTQQTRRKWGKHNELYAFFYNVSR